MLGLAGPVLTVTGGGMLLYHKPHLLVATNATLYALQNDYLDWNIVLPETYSYCVYALGVHCGSSNETHVSARRDAFKYNGLSRVPPSTCFGDATFLNDPEPPLESWSARQCLLSDESAADDVEAGIINCTSPRPIIRVWYNPDDCTGSWTLNSPEVTYPRFIAILVSGIVATTLGCGCMCVPRKLRDLPGLLRVEPSCFCARTNAIPSVPLAPRASDPRERPARGLPRLIHDESFVAISSATQVRHLDRQGLPRR